MVNSTEFDRLVLVLIVNYFTIIFTLRSLKSLKFVKNSKNVLGLDQVSKYILFLR